MNDRADSAIPAAATAAAAIAPVRPLYLRHALPVRIMHWINVVALTVMFMSGLQIFNAHPALYWGAKSTFADPWLSMKKVEIGDAPHGVTTVGGATFDTTGLFGWSGKEGMREQRGFP